MLKEYFYMLMQSSEFDRYAWFCTDSSIRGNLDWERFCDIEITLPDIETQHRFVSVYKALLANQRAYEKGLEDLKLTCDAYITMLSSFHIIHGKNNSDELYKIIEAIQPEIIFEELSFDTFDEVYSDGYIPNTIEAITIKKYLQKHPIKHFPVDTYPINETDLLSEGGAQAIWSHSNEYRELWKEKLSKIEQYGYSFINSDDCIEMLDKSRIIEETVLSEINNERFLNEHQAEKRLYTNRENEMLGNIYNYSKQYPYSKAMFICGAEHRKPLKEKIQEYEAKENLKLNWTFFNET